MVLYEVVDDATLQFERDHFEEKDADGQRSSWCAPLVASTERNTLPGNSHAGVAPSRRVQVAKLIGREM
jgi:hypothetical protein